MDEKTGYCIVGTVTISTDEYKDLITERFEAINAKDRYMREGWNKDSEINDLKKKVEILSAQVEKYKTFIKSHCTINAEDSITLFVDLGE